MVGTSIPRELFISMAVSTMSPHDREKIVGSPIAVVLTVTKLLSLVSSMHASS